MIYEEFLNANRNKLLGYFMLAELSSDPDILETPYPPATLSEEMLDELKDRLRECMPLDSMITDLWDWDIHFEEDLCDDWYFEAVFGADYDRSSDDPEFEDLIHVEAVNFILGWRKRVLALPAEIG
jgi:hypothetical protein